MQTGLGSFKFPRSLLNPVAVPGWILSFDWPTNTAVVRTQRYGDLKCRIATDFSDTDWIEQNADLKNKQYGHKRPYRARERVIVLLVNGLKVIDGVIICSAHTVEHDLNKKSSLPSKHPTTYADYPVNADQWILHIPNDYWFRTVKAAIYAAVEDMTVRSEDADLVLQGYKNVTVTAETESIMATAKKKVKLAAQTETLETTSAQDTTITAGHDLTTDAQGTNPLGVNTTKAATKAMTQAPAIHLTQTGTPVPIHPAILGDVLVNLLTQIFLATQIWGLSHTHGVIAPAVPTTPPLPAPPLTISATWNAGSAATESVLVKLEI